MKGFYLSNLLTIEDSWQNRNSLPPHHPARHSRLSSLSRQFPSQTSIFVVLSLSSDTNYCHSRALSYVFVIEIECVSNYGFLIAMLMRLLLFKLVFDREEREESEESESEGNESSIN